MSVWFKASAPGGALFQTGMGYIEIEWHPELNVSLLYLVFGDHAGGEGTQMAYQYLLTPVDFEDTWHFVVMTGTEDNSELKAYLDGIFIGNLIWKFSGWNSTLNNSNIGALKASLYPGNQEDLHFSGLIDEVAEFDRALSEDEILLHYETGLSGRSLYNIPEPISIDINPESYPNSINPKSEGKIPGWNFPSVS